MLHKRSTGTILSGNESDERYFSRVQDAQNVHYNPEDHPINMPHASSPLDKLLDSKNRVAFGVGVAVVAVLALPCGMYEEFKSR